MHQHPAQVQHAGPLPQEGVVAPGDDLGNAHLHPVLVLGQPIARHHMHVAQHHQGVGHVHLHLPGVQLVGALGQAGGDVLQRVLQRIAYDLVVPGGQRCFIQAHARACQVHPVQVEEDLAVPHHRGPALLQLQRAYAQGRDRSLAGSLLRLVLLRSARFPLHLQHGSLHHQRTHAQGPVLQRSRDVQPANGHPVPIHLQPAIRVADIGSSGELHIAAAGVGHHPT